MQSIWPAGRVDCVTCQPEEAPEANQSYIYATAERYQAERKVTTMNALMDGLNQQNSKNFNSAMCYLHERCRWVWYTWAK